VNSPVLATSLALMTLEVYYRHDLLLEPASEKFTDRELSALWSRWARLGFEGRRQVHRLARQPKEVVPFLTERVGPGPLPTAAEQERAERLIRDLDDDDFAVREAAAKSLEALGGRPRRPCDERWRQALAGRAARVERLLDKYTQSVAAEPHSTRRALDVLEQANTPESWAVVERLAKGRLATGSRTRPAPSRAARSIAAPSVTPSPRESHHAAVAASHGGGR
jgi:hypothetical protein